MTQLIVALDTEDLNNLIPSLYRAGVTFFKLGADAVMDPIFGCVLQTLRNRRCDFFLDLKLYDTRDTVERVARRAFDLGARFLTVHATPSILEAAMRAKPPGDYHKVLAVGPLTDGAGTPISGWRFDGLVCSVEYAAAIRDYDCTDLCTKIKVCPGIRPLTTSSAITGSHVNPATPIEAIRAGADYIVVGRPIYAAHDPVAAARAIIAEIEEAGR